MKPTIYSVVRGRTGNQFFQYAFARKIQKITHIDNLVMDFSELGLNRNAGKCGTGGNNNVLDYFSVVPYVYVDEGCSYKGDIITRIQYSIYRIRRKITSIIGYEKSLKLERLDHRFLQMIGIYSVSSSNCLDLIKFPKSSRRHILIRGFFEAPALFEDIQELLRSELASSQPCSEEVSKLCQELHSQNSICVQIRRGDFTSAEYKKQFLVCDLEYYRNGIDKILEKYPESCVFVCSDDIEWCKKTLQLNTQKIIYEPDGIFIWETFSLMRSCRYFVISNSTFSFWAQFLGDYEGKIVVAPRIWRNEIPRVKDIYMKDWEIL